VDENELQIFWQARNHGQSNQTGKNQARGNQILKHQTLERAPKEKLARQLIQIIANRYYEKNSAQTH